MMIEYTVRYEYTALWIYPVVMYCVIYTVCTGKHASSVVCTYVTAGTLCGSWT